ncbi:MAG: ATP-binding protein [Geminicoccaceae bacterium]
MPSVLRGDPGRIRQMLVNLAGNAIKFTSEGEVVIRADAASADEDRKSALRLSITDTGAGIPEHVQERLFSAFAQADAGVPRVYGGSGLGLMIAQRLARAMGGDIEVFSDGIHGSRFDVTVRLAEASGEDAPSAPRVDLAGTSILVVDAQERSTQHYRRPCQDVEHARARRHGYRRGFERRAGCSRPWRTVRIRHRRPLHRRGHRRRDRPEDPRDPRHGAKSPRAARRIRHARRCPAPARPASTPHLPKPLTASTLLDSLQQLRAGPVEGGLLTIHSMADSRRKPLRILVADDNPVNCKLASIMLERAGHRSNLPPMARKPFAGSRTKPSISSSWTSRCRS